MIECDRSFIRAAVQTIREASEAYAPEVDVYDQLGKVRDEWSELSDEILLTRDRVAAAEECADVVIAAMRLGTLLTPNFATTLAAKCETLHERSLSKQNDFPDLVPGGTTQ